MTKAAYAPARPLAPGARVAFYVRVSTDDQVKMYGIPVQLRKLHARAASEHWTVVKVYQDDGISGARDVRVGLDALRLDVRRGGIDVVLVLDTSRWARDAVLSMLLAKEIRKHAQLVYLGLPPNDGTPEAKLAERNAMSFDEYERDKIRLRTMEGRLQRALDDKRRPVGRPSYGFRQIKDGEPGAVEHHPEERRTVEWMATKRLAGWSWGEIARDLNQRGVPCRAKRWKARRVLGQWTPALVRGILQNEALAGRAYYNRIDTVARKAGASRAEYVRADAILIPVPPILSDATFARIQASMTADVAARAARPCNPEFILRGRLWCPDCRTTLKTRGKAWRYYACYSRHGKAATCGRRFSAPQLETFIQDCITRILREPGFLDAKLREDELRRGVTDVEVRSAVSYLEGKLIEIGNGIAATVPLLGSADYPQAELQRNLKRLTAQRGDLTAQLIDARAKLGRLMPDLQTVHARARLYRQTLDQLAPGDAAGWAELIRDLTERITVHPGGRFELDHLFGTGLQNVHSPDALSTWRQSSVLQEVPSADDKSVSPRQTALPTLRVGFDLAR